MLNNFYWESPINSSLNSPFSFQLYVTDSYCDNNLRVIPFIIYVNSNNTFIEDKINQFKIHPNPTSALVELRGMSALYKVEVYDYTGKFLQSTNRSTIDLSHYPKGIYLFKIFHGHKTEVLRLVKK